MLMIRFQRIGRRNDPAFRIAVLEKTAGPKAGKYVDLVGTYNPKTKAVTLKPERILDWMNKGAQPSPSLHNLLVKEGVLEGSKKSSVVSKKNLEKNKPAEVAPAAEAPAEEAAADATPEDAGEAAPAEEAAPEAGAADAPAEEVVVAVPDEMEAEVEAEAEPAEADEATAEETPSHAPAADQTGEDKAA